jgi:hypothetical protein
MVNKFKSKLNEAQRQEVAIRAHKGQQPLDAIGRDFGVSGQVIAYHKNRRDALGKLKNGASLTKTGRASTCSQESWSSLTHELSVLDRKIKSLNVVRARVVHKIQQKVKSL